MQLIYYMFNSMSSAFSELRCWKCGHYWLLCYSGSDSTLLGVSQSIGLWRSFPLGCSFCRTAQKTLFDIPN